jgi:hypothetical protein
MNKKWHFPSEYGEYIVREGEDIRIFRGTKVIAKAPSVKTALLLVEAYIKVDRQKSDEYMKLVVSSIS